MSLFRLWSYSKLIWFFFFIRRDNKITPKVITFIHVFQVFTSSQKKGENYECFRPLRYVFQKCISHSMAQMFLNHFKEKFKSLIYFFYRHQRRPPVFLYLFTKKFILYARNFVNVGWFLTCNVGRNQGIVHIRLICARFWKTSL